ncbi:type II toxin-antitoxin system RelE/ParE family toxin [Candidatus Thiodictyon syntrophicum]|jgi:plasmid stabilization system protein ParE|uniref:Plasmid stabilization protein ParE n=1 Tax=Candidatus Thiodictyon syntrophicum TaxID=1166950 RepID=A0A2K8UIS8_9GAMM|nr:type II toxin-antitoxin system RelE/ParE family toxin [Candidatus Thiodictyon syntrophicum]AUB85474.1 hypothetical protein THSYN_31625 [Candidatus Thiodictyon syntrophicum]
MYELSQAAAQDLEEILDRSIVDFGPIQTERYFESLNRCLGLLGENPGMGSTADEIRPGYRRFGHQSHVSSTAPSVTASWLFVSCTNEWTRLASSKTEAFLPDGAVASSSGRTPRWMSR